MQQCWGEWLGSWLRTLLLLLWLAGSCPCLGDQTTALLYMACKTSNILVAILAIPLLHPWWSKAALC